MGIEQLLVAVTELSMVGGRGVHWAAPRGLLASHFSSRARQALRCRRRALSSLERVEGMLYVLDFKLWVKEFDPKVKT